MARARRKREEREAAPALDVQEHADRLLSQATEIGQSVWSKASTFWKEGKKKVAKVYEEQAVVSTPPTDGRPKWMQESGDPLRRTKLGFRQDLNLNQNHNRRDSSMNLSLHLFQSPKSTYLMTRPLNNHLCWLFLSSLPNHNDVI